ncbi:alanine/glycine:cation symporter family protein [Sphingobacterium hungaricum]|uniref:Sodium:alanine symporter n=1 Tax=Sphingobacterium hungaricum TaxID=2082723 RepID=A0A928UWL8_9SPHI|nr:alanine/glycine:cation symporter family protein [Sphingobacterium hungaricum]MBE8712655.1 sodium:alanine symporter [Sphingobacterium hungaricum]
MQNIIEKVYNIIWSDALVYFCLLAGIYFTIVLKFPQLTHFREMLRLLFKGKSSAQGISSFQAFSLAISGRVGTGNIAGVATAIGMGGPGAVFWMWVIAFLGSASAIIEATLAQMYKEINDGQYRGGPAFYILKGLNSKFFAWAFAIVTIFSTGLLLPSVQSNSISVAIDSAFNISPAFTGVFLSIFLALIIIGGVRRISKVAEYVVPFMAGSYIIMALVIMALNYKQIPSIIELIISSALNLDSTFGAVAGTAIAWGVKRGIYSNEAGQGTAPHAAAAAEVSHPVKQGLVQGFSVYVDTLIVCTATAFMILFTGQFNVQHPSGGFIVENIPSVEMGAAYTQYAVSSHFPSIGSGFVALALTFFAFTTIMAYYYIAETNVQFLSRNGKNQILIWILRVSILGSVYIGCISTAESAWLLGDIGVGMMAWLNLIAIFLLHRKMLVVFKDYNLQKKKKKDPVFTNEHLKFPSMETWSNK